MTVLDADSAIQRFKQNEERVDKFVNQTGTYTTNETTPRNVETLSAFLIRVESEIGAAGSIAITEANKQAADASAVLAGVKATAADTAKTAAELARDAAIIGAGVYTTEAAGRAAVADGAAFKVQGSGDIAAYEYRRVNSGSSTLIATYPSKGYIDGGKGTAGTAKTAGGAGYDSFNPSSIGSDLLTLQSSVSITKGEVGNPITVTKVANTGSSTWFGVHIKISYSSLSELNKLFNFNVLTVAGTVPNTLNILSGATDWNPSNSPVGLNLTASLNGGAGVNLYTVIMASQYASVYQARTDLHIVLAYFNPSSTAIDAATATWTIRPFFESSLDVIANKVTAALRAELTTASVAPVKTKLDEVSAFVSASKVPITDISGVKQFPASTVTIDSTYTYSYEGAAAVDIGYDVTLLNTQGYSYSRAKIFNDYATEAANKKFRVFIKTDNKDAVISLLFTSGASWGPNPGNAIAQDTTVTLNAANNYSAFVDIDYSAMAAFYAVSGRNQVGYFILAHDGRITTQAVKFSTYCFDISNMSSQVAKMTNGFVSTLFDILTSVESEIGLMKADIIELQNSINAGSITCWGDSLTAGGGWTTTLQTLSGLTVYNGGTGGETSQTIFARQGGDVMIANNITIPATTTPVLIASRSTDGGIKTALGATVTPLLQGGAHINPCKIGDVVGTLSWTGSSYADMNGTWTFTRTTAGAEVQITRPTAIRTDFDINRNDGIQIIFIGQNGGYTSNDDLIRQHRLMIEHSTAKDTVILGLSSGSAASRADYEAAMKLAFGRYFISLREYLATPIYTNSVITSCYGLQDAGLTPTQADLTAIATGTVPPQLLADSVHYTDACKTVIGNMVYRKMRDLNIV